jgi:hypothetical protein
VLGEPREERDGEQDEEQKVGAVKRLVEARSGHWAVHVLKKAVP